MASYLFVDVFTAAAVPFALIWITPARLER